MIPASQISEVLLRCEGQKLIWILNIGVTPGEDMHESSGSGAVVDSLAFLTRQKQNVHYTA